ncbi:MULTISPECIES: RES family NAD+ phosphorylase [Lysobacter]|uniref:RES family NAD+ phosphorylase n=1 Tax=Lysobacter TaxID=68 RepID=UPI001F428F53|nr:MULTISPECIES: RES family NAD+ phosphorylase [Lysobacter]UJB19590.1 RES family NAD+ phosphorylase [Lysobacter capsici]UJQ26684.1 RES family NAD+ phosphorylase [Lysobacter gummosus]
MSNTERQDGLDKALDDSFPASDPPSMTAGSTATPTEPHAKASSESQASYVSIYRVVQPPESDKPFGRRPTYPEGHWSSQGRPAIYASVSAAGAILEHLAHARPGESDDVLLARAMVPADCILSQTALPSTWADYPYRDETQAIGDHWIDEHKSLGLRLPSALSPDDCNILINPEHEDHVHITSITTIPVKIDARLRKDLK